jgi:lysozyme
MAHPMRMSRTGLELVKSFEGFRARSAALPQGGYIIGHGHTAAARANQKISRPDAELILRHHDLVPVEDAVQTHILAPLSQHEFDALVSFAFNIGIQAFKKSSVVSLINEGNRLAAADAMLAWRKARIDGELKVIDALVRRRAVERALFLEHANGRAGVPSALVRPELDVAASLMTSKEQAIVVESNYDGDRVEILPSRERAAATPPTESGPPGDATGATQAAAIAVKKRLVRILGENAEKASGESAPGTGSDTGMPDPQGSAGEAGITVEEITSAVSALADPQSPVDAREDEDLPDVRDTLSGSGRPNKAAPPPTAIDTPADSILPPADIDLIDDLEPVEIDASILERAAEEHERFARPQKAALLGWLPFALLAGLGIIGAIKGASDYLALAASDAQITSQADKYAGPLLFAGGSFLTLIALYYLYRALTGQEDT